MKNIRFKDIEEGEVVFKKENDSPLQRWYIEAREKKISELSISDLCRAVRQNIYIQHVMPQVILQLEENLSAGELYEGELITALQNNHEIDWDNIPNEKAKLITLLENAQNTADSEHKEAIGSLLQSIQSVNEKQEEKNNA